MNYAHFQDNKTYALLYDISPQTFASLQNNFYLKIITINELLINSKYYNSERFETVF
jgi:hypothetical protein